MSAERPRPAMMRIDELQNAADRKSREAIDCALSAFSIERSDPRSRARRSAHALARRRRLGRLRSGLDDIAEAARGLDDVDAELLAQSSDEDLDRIGIAIEVLLVEMIDDLPTGNDTPG